MMIEALCITASMCLTVPSAMINWQTYSNLQYGLSTQETADLYLLKKGSNPLIIFIHGGGWAGGDKSAYSNLVKQYALAGFSSMSINYRLATEDPSTQWNVQLQDVQEAVRWIRALATSNPSLHIDPNRIAALGGSAGGHLSMFLGTLGYTYINTNPASQDRSTQYYGISPKVQAVVTVSGPADLTSPDGQALMAQTPVLGHKTYQQDPDAFKKFSPVYFFDKNTSPTCIMHGTLDTLVPLTQAKEVASVLQTIGVPYRYYTYEGGHGFTYNDPAYPTGKPMPARQVMSLNSNIINCLSEFLHPDPANARLF